MQQLPRYDSWKLATPQYYTLPLCYYCMHDAEDHDFDHASCTIPSCNCVGYDDALPERDPDEAYDHRREENL